MIPPRLPTREPPPVPVTFGFAALSTLLAALLYIVLPSLVLAIAGEDTPLSPRALNGIALLVAFGAAFAVAASTVPEPPQLALGFRRPAPLAWLTPWLMAPVLLLISELDNVLAPLWALPAPVEDPSAVPAGMTLVIGTLVAVVIEPMARETFFRGWIQGRLAERSGAVRALLEVSLLSMVFPLIPLLLLVTPAEAARAALQTICEALCLGLLRQASGSLYPSILLAALFGAVQLLAEQRALGIPGFDDLGAPHTPWPWLAAAAVSAAASVLLCMRVARIPVAEE